MDSYDIFYRENKNRLFSYLFRLTGDYTLSKDLMQESFTRYFSRYHQKENNCALLYTIARNTALDSIRKRREETLPEAEEASFADTPEDQLINKQAFRKMMAAIRQLNPSERELIALLEAKTFSYKEIGNLLNISEANVKVKVHRARLRLREILGKEGQ